MKKKIKTLALIFLVFFALGLINMLFKLLGKDQENNNLIIKTAQADIPNISDISSGDGDGSSIGGCGRACGIGDSLDSVGSIGACCCCG